MRRRLLSLLPVLLAGVLLAVACRENPAPPLPEKPASATPATKTPEPAPEPAAAAPDAGQCLPVPRQTGAGCDMAGIMAAVRPQRGPGGSIPACYLRHVRPPREGKLLLRFRIMPEGRATGFTVVSDSLSAPGLDKCLSAALEAIDFPPPGDVPCDVVYPFSFVPEVGRHAK